MAYLSEIQKNMAYIKVGQKVAIFLGEFCKKKIAKVLKKKLKRQTIASSHHTG